VVTRWSPDTCDCIIEYDENINLTNVIQRCPAHQGLANNAAVFDSVKEENPRKNQALDEILQRGPSSIFDVDAESGQRVFKKGITVDWAWTGGTAPNRVITLTVNGITLTTTQKNAIRTFLDNRFGVGKVILA
jgi:hypothetical protein